MMKTIYLVTGKRNDEIFDNLKAAKAFANKADTITFGEINLKYWHCVFYEDGFLNYEDTSEFMFLKESYLNKPLKRPFKRKNGFPSYYAFVCGHVEKKSVSDPLFTLEVEMYKEPGCNVWQIRGFKRVNGSSSCDRLFWESRETMTDAIKLYNQKAKELGI